MQLIQDLDIKEGTRVLLRCDLNLPQDDKGKFTDFFRLESSLPTIGYLLDKGVTIFITAHLGSPKGKPDPSLSLQPLTEILSDQLGQKVEFIADPFDLSLKLADKKGVFLLENLRFWEGEEANSLELAQALTKSTGAELFVQDAFGVVHRKHASLTRFPELLPSAAGLLLQKEIQFLSLPETSNLNLLIGGAKVESKLPVISNFIGKADSILTGGVVANTFLKASKEEIGASLFDEPMLNMADETLSEISKSETKLLLPEDYLTATSPDALLAQEFTKENLRADQMILDLGVNTTSTYKSKLNTSDTIIWAGTLGFAENPVFANSSREILNHILDLKVRNEELKIIIGGGDTVDFVRGTLDQSELKLIDHLSTGGGASLLMLSGQELPGITALDKVPDNSQKNSKSQLPPEESHELQSLNKPVLIANLKAHFNLEQAKDWVQEVIKSEVLTSGKLDLLVAAPTLFIEELSSDIKSSTTSLSVISQDISAFEEGAQTGEVAASMLAGMAPGTLIGHSERRNIFHEDESVISEKLKRAIAANLKIVLCVGGKSKELLSHKKEVQDQLTSALNNFNSEKSTLLTIAYEPVFAIGSGDVPTDEFLTEQLESIRRELSIFSRDTLVLYGGSVSPSNTKQIMDLGFNGLLVGSASLKVPLLEDIGINMLR